MSIGSVDNNILSSNPYDRTENRQNQFVGAADKTKEITQTESIQSGTPEGPNDEFIKTGDKPESSAGIYRYERDENGKQIIVFDRPDSSLKSDMEIEEGQEMNDELSEAAEGLDENAGQPKKSNESEESGSSDGAMKCTVNTDKVDAEIKKLKEEKKQIQQKLKNFHGNDEKHKELEKRLSEIDSELRIKDNDAYRKQNATTTYE